MFLCPMQRNLTTKTVIKPNPTMLMALSTVLLFMSNTLAGLMFIVQQNLISYARNKFNILKDFFQLLYFLCYFDMSTINPTVILLLIEQTIKSLQSFIFSSFIYLNTKCIFFSKIRFLRSCRCRVSKFSSNLETFCSRLSSTMA